MTEGDEIARQHRAFNAKLLIDFPSYLGRLCKRRPSFLKRASRIRKCRLDEVATSAGKYKVFHPVLAKRSDVIVASDSNNFVLQTSENKKKC